jgi:hypothetical protein
MRPDKKQLDKFNTFHKADTEFASNARLKQSIWRENNGFKNAKDKPGIRFNLPRKDIFEIK